MSPPRDIALIGCGAIARRSHAPFLLSPGNDTGLRLVATADPAGGLPGFTGRHHADHRALLDAEPGVIAVSVATPAGTHFAVARDALLAGRHVLLEKPAAATLGEVVALERLAAERGLVLVTSLHAQHNATVDRLRDILSTRPPPARVAIEWREDYARYHGDQRWPWQPGGFGVFDFGVNAFSILCHVLPGLTFRVTRARLRVPRGATTPSLVEMGLAWEGGDGEVALEWRRGGDDVKTLTVEGPDGAGGADLLTLRNVRTLLRNGEVLLGPLENTEYAGVYRGFARALDRGVSEVSLHEMRLVADAFTIAEAEHGTDPLPLGG